MEQVADGQLVRRVAEGDEGAFSELYNLYARPVYATGIKLLGDPHLAEELVRDAFADVWRGAAAFDPDREPFANWLHRITHSRAGYLARVGREAPSSNGGDPPEEPPTKPEPDGDGKDWDVARALANLADDHREVLILAYFEGLSQGEISRRTGLAVETIQGRTTAGLKELHGALAGFSEGVRRA